jgi:hypothetical protein
VAVVGPGRADVVAVAEQALVGGVELRDRLADVVAAPRRRVKLFRRLRGPYRTEKTKQTQDQKGKPGEPAA